MLKQGMRTEMSFKEKMAEQSDLNWDGQTDQYDDGEKVGENNE